MANKYDFYQPPVNNAGLDPLQGFDFECWSQDTASGKIAWFGKFQSLTLSVRNATETYLELGQRVPTYLDGEIQIAWVLEQGLVDMEFIKRTFGYSEITREQFLSRGNRFHICFDSNAYELENVADRNNGDEFTRRMGITKYSPIQPDGGLPKNRATKGRYELIRCKPDSVSLGIMPGRRVAAVRWEGVAEGIRFVPGVTVQQFKNNRGLNTGDRLDGFLRQSGNVNAIEAQRGPAF